MPQNEEPLLEQADGNSWRNCIRQMTAWSLALKTFISPMTYLFCARGGFAACELGVTKAKMNITNSDTVNTYGPEFMGGALLTSAFVPITSIFGNTLVFKGGKIVGGAESLSETIKGVGYIVIGCVLVIGAACFDILVAGPLVEESSRGWAYDAGYDNFRENEPCSNILESSAAVITLDTLVVLGSVTSLFLVSKYSMFSGRQLLNENQSKAQRSQKEYFRAIDPDLNGDPLEEEEKKHAVRTLTVN